MVGTTTVLLDDTGTVLMVRRATDRVVRNSGGYHLDNNVSDGRVPRGQEAISLVGERRTGQDVTEWSGHESQEFIKIEKSLCGDLMRLPEGQEGAGLSGVRQKDPSTLNWVKSG